MDAVKEVTLKSAWSSTSAGGASHRRSAELEFDFGEKFLAVKNESPWSCQIGERERLLGGS